MGLLIIASLAICHIAIGMGRYHNFGPPVAVKLDDEDVIHSPWWHGTKIIPDDGPGEFDPYSGYNQHDGDFHIHNHGDRRWNRPNDGGRPSGRWPPWLPNPADPDGLPVVTPTSMFVTSTSTILPSGINFVELCKRQCPSTPEHNPVCGSDNVTYGNMGKLECAKNCGVDVQIKRTGTCKIPPPIPLNDENNEVPEDFRMQVCLRDCPTTPEYNPVCGTNNVTYTNPGRLECARVCGVDVQISRKTACSVAATTTPANDVVACMLSCSVTTEYNPVCGSDNVTYANPGRLECAQNCGVDVQLSRKTSCLVAPGPEIPTSTNPTLTTSTTKEVRGDLSSTETPNEHGKGYGNGHGDWHGHGNWHGNWHGNGNGNENQYGNIKPPSITDVIACIQVCPLTTEVNPVCGTDGVTYTNPGKLLCSQFCGVDVRVRKFGTCSGQPLSNPYPMQCPTLPPTEAHLNPTQDCINRCPTSQEFSPVCGTDHVTYLNLQSLQCKMKCGVDVAVLKRTPCEAATEQPFPQTPTQKPPTQKPTPQPPPVWANTDRPTQPTVPVVTVPAIPGNVIQDCIKECYTSLEFQPVCGTNGKTYSNLAKLECEKRCGINVELKYTSECDNSPIKEGNKDETTKKPDIDFTIPQDVLASIFPDLPVSTQPTKDSEEYDLDQRFGEGDAMNKTSIV